MLCAAEMSRKSEMLALALAFEVNGEGNVGSQRRLWVRDIIRGKKQYGAYNNLVQELRLDARFVAYFRLDRVLCSETSTIYLPAIFSIFLVVFVVMETTHHSLVIGQL